MPSRNNLALSKQVMDIAEPMIRRKGTFFGLPKSSIHAAVSSIVLALEKKKMTITQPYVVASSREEQGARREKTIK